MTNTPEQYRALADNATETGEYSIEDRWIRSAQTALRAAADEVDCLRDVADRRDEQPNRITPERYRGIAGELVGNPTTFSMQEAIFALRTAADEIDRFRASDSNARRRRARASMTTDQYRALAGELEGSEYRTVLEGAVALRAAADEVDHLRAVIENTPWSPEEMVWLQQWRRSRAGF